MGLRIQCSIAVFSAFIEWNYASLCIYTLLYLIAGNVLSPTQKIEILHNFQGETVFGVSILIGTS